jgi:hypothetical protein
MLLLALFAEKRIYAQIYYPSGISRIVPRKEKRKMKISGTVDDDLYKWMRKRIQDGTFYNPSHAIQRGLVKLKENEDHNETE